MAKLAERASLRVEGGDDMHAIRHLLIRHGVDYDQDQAEWPPWFPSIEAVVGGKDAILNSRTVETAVSLSSGRAVGFVLDADSSVPDRWRAISNRLGQAGVVPPSVLPAEGFVGQSDAYGARVGVWLMPDNQQEGTHGEGTLERFLETLVEDDDSLFRYARETTARAQDGPRGELSRRRCQEGRAACVARMAARTGAAVRYCNSGAILHARQPGGCAVRRLVSPIIRMAGAA